MNKKRNKVEEIIKQHRTEKGGKIGASIDNEKSRTTSSPWKNKADAGLAPICTPHVGASRVCHAGKLI